MRVCVHVSLCEWKGGRGLSAQRLWGSLGGLLNAKDTLMGDRDLQPRLQGRAALGPGSGRLFLLLPIRGLGLRHLCVHTSVYKSTAFTPHPLTGHLLCVGEVGSGRGLQGMQRGCPALPLTLG